MQSKDTLYSAIATRYGLVVMQRLHGLEQLEWIIGTGNRVWSPRWDAYRERGEFI